VKAGAVAAGGGAGDGDVVRISAERGDVIAHPLQRAALILQSVVPGRTARILRGERAVRQESKRPEPVIRRDDDDAGFLREFRPLCDAKFADAATNEPVCSQTMTGAGVAGRGCLTQRFSRRQSSSPAGDPVLTLGQLGGVGRGGQRPGPWMPPAAAPSIATR
jgi:hypothetical protein